MSMLRSIHSAFAAACISALALTLACGPAQAVGGWGTIDTVGAGKDTITLVKVGGTRYEMGFWYGKLLAGQIAGCHEKLVMLAKAANIDFTPAIEGMWNATYFDTKAWGEELQGVADGCAASEHPEITFRIMQEMLMVGDISEYNCSLFAAWGKATKDGDVYQLRNLDWTMDAGIQEYPVVAIYHPKDGQVHAVIGFAAMLGVAGGGMNDCGLAVSEIMGHFGDKETLNGIPFPVLLRDVLYHEKTLNAGLARMRNAVRTNQYHFALADPKAPGAKGRLIFSSHQRFDVFADVRIVGHPVETPDPFHERLEDVVYWRKHNGSGNQELHDALAARYGKIDGEKAIEIAQAAGVEGTLLSVVYHNTAKEFWVAFAEGMEPAHKQGYVHFTMK